MQELVGLGKKLGFTTCNGKPTDGFMSLNDIKCILLED